MAATLLIDVRSGGRNCWPHRRRCVLRAGSQGISIDPLSHCGASDHSLLVAQYLSIQPSAEALRLQHFRPSSSLT